MKYMLLMQAGGQGWEESLGTWTQDDLKAMVDFMHELDQELENAGELVDAQGLADPSHGKIVQARDDGEPVITDGPFPESKEVLAGYWIIDVPSMDRAVEIAARISAQPGR